MAEPGQPSRSRYPEPSAGAYPEPVSRLIESFLRLPGIGRRSAERLAFHVLKSPEDEATALAGAIRDVKKLVRHCDVCFNLSREALCSICADARRDRSRVLAVEQPKDLLAIETTGAYRGLYHVLMGRIDPMEGVGPEDITLDALLRRVDEPSVNAGRTAIEEVILGTNPTLEGDATAMYIGEQLATRRVRVTRLARGVPLGGRLEQAGKAVLADAIEGRTPAGG